MQHLLLCRNMIRPKSKLVVVPIANPQNIPQGPKPYNPITYLCADIPYLPIRVAMCVWWTAQWSRTECSGSGFSAQPMPILQHRMLNWVYNTRWQWPIAVHTYVQFSHWHILRLWAERLAWLSLYGVVCAERLPCGNAMWPCSMFSLTFWTLWRGLTQDSTCLLGFSDKQLNGMCISLWSRVLPILFESYATDLPH